MRLRDAGRHALSAAFVARTICDARTVPLGVVSSFPRMRVDRRALVQRDARIEHRPPQCAHEEPRLDGRAVAEEDAAAEHRRCAAGRHFVAGKRDGLFGMPHSHGGLDSVVDRRILRRRGRHHQHPRLAQPHVLAALLREGAHAGHDRLRRASQLTASSSPSTPRVDASDAQ